MELGELGVVGSHGEWEEDLGQEVGGCGGEGRCRTVEAAIVELNLMRRELREVPCAVCSQVGGERRLYCGLCGKVVHKLCVRRPTKLGYWYCTDCAPQLDSSDPAQDLELQRVVLGGAPPGGWSPEDVERVREQFLIRRGHLIDCREEQERVIPRPYDRPGLIQDTHESLAHVGWDRV